MSIERKPSAVERKAILAPVRKFIQHKYNVTVTRNDTIGLKPPYVILANHVTNWDPLFINCYVDESISFVAAASTFQKPLMQKVLGYTGAISKTKSQADSSTIRNIMKAIKFGRVVGIFPEGNRTWNGQTEPIVFSTAKLIRSLRVPVVIVNIKGGYLSHPRWAETVHKGKVEVELRKVIEGDELKGMTPEQVHEILVRELYVDDFEWQKQTGQLFEGKQLANYLERYIFTCPSCEQVGHMHSHDDQFECQVCHYKVRYTNTGTFAQVNKPLKYQYIYDWNHWQRQLMADKIEDAAYQATVIKKLNAQVHVTKMTKDDEFVDLGQFKMSIHSPIIEFIPGNSKAKNFKLEMQQMEGLNIFKQKIINFLYEGEQYHIELQDVRASAYLFISFIEELTKHIEA